MDHGGGVTIYIYIYVHIYACIYIYRDSVIYLFVYLFEYLYLVGDIMYFYNAMTHFIGSRGVGFRGLGPFRGLGF